MDQTEFQHKQNFIYADLAAAVLDSIPEEWNKAELILGPAVIVDGFEMMSHELSNPDFITGLRSVTPNETIYEHTRQLELLFREFGTSWIRASFRLIRDVPVNQWRFTMEYDYEK